MTQSVAIFGCGPAGMMVALAADLAGWDFRIYSRKEKSKLYGAQYLHHPLPGIDSGLPITVRYELRGSPEQYRRKVYGDAWDGRTSPEDYETDHPAWDIRHAYDQLWDLYHTEIVDTDFANPGEKYRDSPLLRARRVGAKHEQVVSTIPRPVWDGRAEYKHEKVWALGDTEIRRVKTLVPAPDSTVICNGTNKQAWYRISNIFGYATMEWPYQWDPDRHLLEVPPPTRGASVVRKPLSHNSKHARDFHHMGRYGKWEKGVLTTDAYFEADRLFRG